MGPPGPGTLKLVTAATAGGFAFQNGTKVASTWARAAAGVRVGSAGSATDSVFHPAAVVSGAAEAVFDLGMRVNLDGTRVLLEACRRLPKPARLVFTSSVAVFGGRLPPVLNDDTPLRPETSYGGQKA